jgi:hypothetical protein
METSKIKDFSDATLDWNRFVDSYVNVFVRALNKLQGSKYPLPADEVSLSKMLVELLKQSCVEILEETGIRWGIPQWERPIPPKNLTEPQRGMTEKRPDFTCVYPNRRPGFLDNYEVHLHIECKLLGKHERHQKQYVVEGIKRFDTESHKYGENAPAGLMIGYIFSKSPEDIQEKVNKHITEQLTYHPRLQFTFNSKPVHKYTGKFVREAVQPSEFSIVHIWVDLRQQQ